MKCYENSLCPFSSFKSRIPDGSVCEDSSISQFITCEGSGNNTVYTKMYVCFWRKKETCHFFKKKPILNVNRVIQNVTLSGGYLDFL